MLLMTYEAGEVFKILAPDGRVIAEIHHPPRQGRKRGRKLGLVVPADHRIERAAKAIDKPPHHRPN